MIPNTSTSTTATTNYDDDDDDDDDDDEDDDDDDDEDDDDDDDDDGGDDESGVNAGISVIQACRHHPKTVKPFQDGHPVRTLHFLWLGLELHVLPFVAGGIKNPAIIQDPIGRRRVDASIDEHLQLQDIQRYFHAQGAKQTTSPCILHKKCTLTQISGIVISTAQKWIVDTGPAGLSAPSAAPHLGWWTQQCAKFLPVAVVILDQSRPLPTSRWKQMNTWKIMDDKRPLTASVSLFLNSQVSPEWRGV